MEQPDLPFRTLPATLPARLTTADIADLGEDERRVRVLRALGAIGWSTRAVVHLLFAGIVAKIAISGGTEPQQASKSGVLVTLLDKPLGTILVACVGVGGVTYAAARLLPLLLDRTEARTHQWLRSGGTALVYLSMAAGCWRLIHERYESDWGQDRSTQQLTGSLLQSWWGTVAVGVGALVLIGYGGYQLWRGASRRFAERIDDDRAPLTPPWVQALGIAGFASRGIIAVTAGGFAAAAALRHDPGEIHGLDGSFRTLLRAPAGLPIVLMLAAGLACFAVYCALAATARDHENG